MRAANETQLETVDQNMSDVQTDHDMADVAVVEHPHPHEDEEHVEWEHLDKGYFDDDDGNGSGSCAGPSWCPARDGVHGRTRRW